jgi:hypothetical protein
MSGPISNGSIVSGHASFVKQICLVEYRQRDANEAEKGKRLVLVKIIYLCIAGTGVCFLVFL